MMQNDSGAKRKLCSELDKQMQEDWEDIKGVLEEAFEFTDGIEVSLSDREVFKGLLIGFMNELARRHFPFQFDDDEKDTMVKRAVREKQDK